MTDIGNKAGGGSEVTATSSIITVDGVATNLAVGLDQTAVDARVTALTQAEELEANAGKLKRVDTGIWEAAQTGVEYYAPAPFNAFGSKARAQRFTGTGAGAEITLVASGVVNSIAAFGSSTDSVTGYIASYGSAHNATYGIATTVKTGGSLTLQRGGYVDDAADSWDIIAVYVIA